MKNLLLIIIIITFSSCFKEDQTIKLPPTAGELKEGVIALTGTYKYQVFYDLKTNKSVKSNLITDWDLGFSCSDTAWYIILNNSKLMHAGNTFSTDFSAVTSQAGIDMAFDASSGNKDSLAIKDWYYINDILPVSNNYVYVIDRGQDETYTSIGYKKIMFDTPVGNSYKIRYADLDGQNEHTLIIDKDPNLNYVCFSFEKGIVDIEPPKTDWSLLFTQYQTTIFDDGTPVPYAVRGVLQNPYLVKSAQDTTFEFSDISINDTINFEFSSRLDFIGYDWKYYNFNSGSYLVLLNRNYIIYNNDNYFYKLKFTSFYNKTGEKGYPSFLVGRL